MRCGICLAAALASATAALSAPASADDAADPRWSGFYAGVYAGYDWYETETGDYYGYDHGLDGVSAGFQAGYDHQFRNGIVAGLIGSAGWSDASGGRLTVDNVGGFNLLTRTGSTIKAHGSLRGRLGYAAGAFLPYVTGGLAWARQDVEYYREFGLGFTANVRQTSDRLGWVVGAGVEYALTDSIALKGEYLYADLGTDTYPSVLLGPAVDGKIALESRRLALGVNYRF
ncbi:MAG: outer membrane beta-barrel protein [Parvibaculum sp.]